MAIASASTSVSLTNFTASSGSVSSWSCEQLALGAVAVFLLAHAGFERAEHAEFAFDRDAAEMRHVGDGLGDADIVVLVAGRLAVGLQRAVHHHRGEAGLDRGHAGGGFVAVVEMHADRDVRIDFGHRVHHVLAA